MLRQVVFYRTSEGKEGKEIGERKLLSIRELNKGRRIKRSRVRFNERQNRMKSCLHFGAGLHDGEFDPGSERTLAARLKHASRTNVHPRVGGSGGRVSNTWVICPPVGNSTWKHVIIPHDTVRRMPDWESSCGSAGG